MLAHGLFLRQTEVTCRSMDSTFILVYVILMPMHPCWHMDYVIRRCSCNAFVRALCGLRHMESHPHTIRVNIHNEFSGVDISMGKLGVFLVWVRVTTFRRFKGWVKEAASPCQRTGPSLVLLVVWLSDRSGPGHPSRHDGSAREKCSNPNRMIPDEKLRM